METAKEKYVPYVLLISVALIWGSSFILMKRGLDAFSSGQVASMRIFLTFMVLLPFAYKHLKEVPRKSLWIILFVSLLGTGIPPFLFTEAETVISSATAGILNSLTPLFTLIIGVMLFKNKFNKMKVIGVLVGLGGAFWMVWNTTNESISLDFYGMLVVFAGICYAISGNTIKNYLQGVKPFVLTTTGFMMLGIPAGSYLFYSDVISTFQTHPLAFQSFIYTFILALVCTAFANVLFFTLIQKSNAVFAQSTTYLMPLVAIMWGVLDGETISIKDLGGIVLILTGIYLVNFPDQKNKKTEVKNIE